MKLLLAALCQTALSDPDVGHSLIAVFNDAKIQLQASGELPSNAVIPRDWAIFSKWRLHPDEIGTEFSQVTDVFWPDGTVLVHHVLKSAQPSTETIAFIVRQSGFPIGQNGTVKIRLSIIDAESIVHGETELEMGVQVESEPIPT